MLRNDLMNEMVGKLESAKNVDNYKVFLQKKLLTLVAHEWSKKYSQKLEIS